MKKIVYILFGTVLMLVSLPSCTSLMITPHENFKNHMKANLGLKLGDSNVLWMKADRFIEKKSLLNGNIENAYEFRGNCRYFFEYNPETRIIVNWRFEGSEKDCAIVP